eukprot:m.334706 g.334706  ORF g.334706 m.334706 type:complete len:226 (+) comp20512_c0_seq2:106-783(+)
MVAVQYSWSVALTVLASVLQVRGLRNPSGNQVENAFTYKIPAHGHMCFYQEVDQNDVVELELQVVKGGSLDIDFTIVGAQGEILQQGRRKSEGIWEGLASHKGEIELCMSNSFSMVTDKEIFILIILDKAHAVQKQLGDTASEQDEAIMNVNVQADKIYGTLRKITNMQDHMRVREARHRNTAQSNLNRVNNMSLLESVVVMFVGFCQIVAIRRLFKDTGRGGSV